jgi:hypothetical protein
LLGVGQRGCPAVQEHGKECQSEGLDSTPNSVIKQPCTQGQAIKAQEPCFPCIKIRIVQTVAEERWQKKSQKKTVLGTTKKAESAGCWWIMPKILAT